MLANLLTKIRVSRYVNLETRITTAFFDKTYGNTEQYRFSCAAGILAKGW